ncbi:hypothetical protein GCM10020221_02700 [Streptomyces thioluteus]|uniref:Uncharacterized protein n=1 Tax=Streptomyces thioluteus TaxID=66431 RepID=A0ABN3WBH9_STRTU
MKPDLAPPYDVRAAGGALPFTPSGRAGGAEMPVDRRALRRRAVVAMAALALTGLLSVFGGAPEAGTAGATTSSRCG